MAGSDGPHLGLELEELVDAGRCEVQQRIEFVATLPRNAYNKVQTHVLKQQFGGPAPA